jgi:hypothetical protein
MTESEQKLTKMIKEFEENNKKSLKSIESLNQDFIKH